MYKNKYDWLTTLLILVIAGCVLSFAPAAATNLLTATDKCSNYKTQGIEYNVAYTAAPSTADEWRSPFKVSVTSNGTYAGTIEGIQMEVSGTDTLYQCEQRSTLNTYEYACTSLPVSSTITGIYVLYKPDDWISETSTFDVSMSSVTYAKTLLAAYGTLKYPPAPCSTNEGPSNWAAAEGYSLVVNTGDCTSQNKDDIVRFTDTVRGRFAITNIVPNETLIGNRFMLDVSPNGLTYDFDLRLYFLPNGMTPENYKGDDISNEYIEVPYHYYYHDYDDEGTADFTGGQDALNNIRSDQLPLTFIYGEMDGFNTGTFDTNGNPVYPTATDFTFKFYYQNTTGTLGYENSSIHFIRTLKLRFAPLCELDNESNDVPSVVGTTRYDPCQSTMQVFNASFEDANGEYVDIDYNGSEATTSCEADKCTDASAITIQTSYPEFASNYYFVTRKCTDSACSATTGTAAYPYSITVSDGDNTSLTYTVSSVWSNTFAQYSMRLWKRLSPNRPFRIKSVRFMADSEGTYEVRGFVTNANLGAGNHDLYGLKFLVTVNGTDSMTSCTSPGTNGYYTAKWNSCLDNNTTQLVTFKATSEEHRGYIENQSAKTLYFKYNGEYSYLPTALEMASLDCYFTAIADGANVDGGYCDKNGISIPAYSIAHISGGSMYMHKIPDPDAEEYRIAYVRTDTYNKMIMHMAITQPDCDTASTIPDTGYSLRSPMNKSANAQSDIVFTGNSLQIPAIGLGMEFPVPIVHVYYKNGSINNGWDLSTLGGYIGELEGGQYLPYEGNSALTGHYYSNGVFKNLEYLNPDDEIIIYANDGIKYVYRVTEKFITQPNDVYSMFQTIGGRSVTLVTCENYNLVTDEYERRQLVRAVLSYQEPYERTW